MSEKNNDSSEQPDNRNPDNKHHQVQTVEQYYGGPIPSSVEFQRYEEVLPGAANRILTMAEAQQEHNNTVERREQIWHYLSKFSAQLVVLVVALAAIVAGTYLIINGHDATGIAVIIGALASFALAVIFGKTKSDDN